MWQVFLLFSLLSLLSSCSVLSSPKPELDPARVQKAITVLGEHVLAIEKKLGIEYPKVEAK